MVEDGSTVNMLLFCLDIMSARSDGVLSSLSSSSVSADYFFTSPLWCSDWPPRSCWEFEASAEPEPLLFGQLKTNPLFPPNGMGLEFLTILLSTIFKS